MKKSAMMRRRVYLLIHTQAQVKLNLVFEDEFQVFLLMLLPSMKAALASGFLS